MLQEVFFDKLWFCSGGNTALGGVVVIVAGIPRSCHIPRDFPSKSRSKSVLKEVMAR